jgi:hypothetical protein
MILITLNPRVRGPAPVYSLNAQGAVKFSLGRPRGGSDRPALPAARREMPARRKPTSAKSLNRLGDGWLSLHAVMALARIGDHHQGE